MEASAKLVQPLEFGWGLHTVLLHVCPATLQWASVNGHQRPSMQPHIQTLPEAAGYPLHYSNHALMSLCTGSATKKNCLFNILVRPTSLPDTLMTLTTLDAAHYDSKESLKGHNDKLWVLETSTTVCRNWWFQVANRESINQGSVTTIGSIVTAATTGQNFDQLFSAFDCDHADFWGFDRWPHWLSTVDHWLHAYLWKYTEESAATPPLP